jgi:hypothetical protein
MKKLIKGYMDFPTYMFSFKQFLHYFKGQFGHNGFKRLTPKNQKSVVGRVYTTWKEWKEKYTHSPKNVETAFDVSKYADRYKQYLEYSGDKDLFIQEFNNVLKTMYPTFGINITPFITDTFNYEAFNLYLTQLSSTEYIQTSTFKGIIFANYIGHFKFFKNEDFVEAINKQEIKISYPSDLFPRLKI